MAAMGCPRVGFGTVRELARIKAVLQKKLKKKKTTNNQINK